MTSIMFRRMILCRTTSMLPSFTPGVLQLLRLTTQSAQLLGVAGFRMSLQNAIKILYGLITAQMMHHVRGSPGGSPRWIEGCLNQSTTSPQGKQQDADQCDTHGGMIRTGVKSQSETRQNVKRSVAHRPSPSVSPRSERGPAGIRPGSHQTHHQERQRVRDFRSAFDTRDDDDNDSISS
jgi:hypothetical protein